MQQHLSRQRNLDPVSARVSHWSRAGLILIFFVGLFTIWQLSMWTLSVFSQPTDGVAPVTSSSLLQQGHEAFRRGAFEQAADTWQQAAKSAHEAGNLREESDAHVALAQSYLALGFHTRAAQNLELAVAMAQSAGDPSRQAAALDLLGQTYLAAGRPEPALETLENAKRLA